MAKTRPNSRLYALLHPDMWKWGGDSVPQSTVAWCVVKKQTKKTYIIWECYKKNGEKNIYLFEKQQ